MSFEDLLAPLALLLVVLLGLSIRVGWAAARRRGLRTTVLEHLAVLTRRGLPLGAGLVALAKERSESRGGRARRETLVIRGVAERFESTASLADALASQPTYFSADVVSLTRVAEDKGAVPEAVLVLVEEEQGHANALARFVERSCYPLLLLGAVLGLSIFLSEVLEPRFEQVTVGMGVTELRTKAAATVTTALLLLLVTGAAGLALVLEGGAPGGSLAEGAARALAALPWVGPPIRHLRSARWLSRVAALLTAGATFPEALEGAASVAKGATARSLGEAARLAREGTPLAQVLAHGLGRDAGSLVPPILLESRVNGLGSALASTASRIGARARRRLDAIGKAIRPVPIALAGSVVAIHAWVTWGALLSVQEFTMRMIGP